MVARKADKVITGRLALSGKGAVKSPAPPHKVYKSGMVRHDDTDKPDYTLIDEPMLTRWAAHMTAGAKRFGRENWRNADSKEELYRFRASAYRHFIQYMRGDEDEDHAAALFFNVSACEMVKKKL